MKKLLLLLIISISFNITAHSQNLDSLRAELSQIKNCQSFFEENKKLVKSHQYKDNIAIVELNSVSLKEEGFVSFCQDYSKRVVDFERNLKNYSNASEYHIVFSCDEIGQKTELKIYCEETIKVPILISKNTEITRHESRLNDYKSRLEKIKNTKKLYQELSNTLQHQINYNMVETVDNAGDLLLKHVSIPNGGKLKELAMEKVRKEKSIDNKTAEVLNKAINVTEKITKLVPGGDKLTNHYLWRLFKSTPEAGKGLGHLAASINIYFRKNEYKEKLEELKKEEDSLTKLLGEEQSISSN